MNVEEVINGVETYVSRSQFDQNKALFAQTIRILQLLRHGTIVIVA